MPRLHKFLLAAEILYLALALSACNSELLLTPSMSGERQRIDPDASYFDREERFALLRATPDPVLLAARPAPRPCDRQSLPEPVGLLTLPLFYEDPAGYAKTSAPLRRFEDFVTEQAAFYVVTKDALHARCIAGVLESWADTSSLFHFTAGSNRQAWYNAVWATVSAGFAYSIVRDDPSLPAPSKQAIEAWLNKTARKHRAVAGGQRDCCNNHAYWRGLESAIVGVVSGDRELFLLGVDAYRSALASLNRDGSFPFEMERGDRAIHYQNFAILPLVYIAEIARRQKVDLYSVVVDGRSLHDAIGFLLAAIDNPAAARQYTDRAQDLSFMNNRSELNWMEPYHARFPNQRTAAILKSRRPIRHRYAGGNSTLFFYNPAHR